MTYRLDVTLLATKLKAKLIDQTGGYSASVAAAAATGRHYDTQKASRFVDVENN